MFYIKDKKVFWFWFLWVSGTIAFIALSRPIFFSSLWGTLIGISIFSILISLPLSKVLQLLPERNLIWVIIILQIAFFIFYTAFAIHKHNNFFTGYDLAIFDQALWKLSQFNIPDSSIRNVPVIFADHFDPVITTLAPFYRFISSPKTLLVLQSAILILPVYIFYKWGKEENINNKYIIILSLFYLTSPALQAVINFDFHEIIFAPLFLITVFYFLNKKKWLPYFIFTTLLILTKETLPLLVSVIGVFIAVKHKKCQIGVATFILGLASFFTIVKIIMPQINYPHANYAYLDMYPGFENGLIKGGLHFLTHPVKLIQNLFSQPIKWWSILVFILPLSASILVVPANSILFLSIIAERILSSYSSLFYMKGQYNILFAPLGLITYLYFLKRKQKLPNTLKRYKVDFALVLVTVPLAFNLIYSAKYTYLLSPIKNWNSLKTNPKLEWSSLLKEIPKNIPAAGTQIFLPHLSQRETLYQLPKINNAEYIILHTCPSKDQVCNNWPLKREQLHKLKKYFKENSAFEAVKETEHGAVFKRTGKLDNNLKQDLQEICAEYILNSYLEPMHRKYFLNSCIHK